MYLFIYFKIEILHKVQHETRAKVTQQKMRKH